VLWHLRCFCILQFSFRLKEKSDKKHKSGLGDVNEGNESTDSDRSSKVDAMSEADVERYMEQMLVSVIFLKLILNYSLNF